jgi:hypothetical protein
MNYKIKFITVSDSETDIFRHNTEVDTISQVQHVASCITAFATAGKESVPVNSGDSQETNEDGRLVCTSTFTGFVSIEDAELFLRALVLNGPNTEIIDAWNITHNVRQRTEIVDADGNLAKLIQDNTALEQRTIPINLADPFYIHLPAE